MTSKPTINTSVGNIEGVSQNITASAQSIVFPVGEDTGILLYLSGNSAGHNATFEGTVDGTNWFLIPAVRTDTFALLTTTGVVAGNLTFGLWLVAAGCAAFRVRSTAHTSGTATWTASYEEEICFPPLAALSASITGNPVLGAGTNLVGAAALSASSTVGTGESIARINSTLVGANIKASAGRLYGGTLTNHNAAARYVHFYNKASAAVVGTDTPVATIGLAPNATVNFGDALGMAFATGISWAVTTDNIAIPATAGAAGDISGTLQFA